MTKDHIAPRFFKETLKRLVTSLGNHHETGNKPDILILSSPRSGSTWLMNMLYKMPGVKYINEPLSMEILNFNKMLPISTRRDYLSLTKDEKIIIRDYFSNDKKIKHFGPYNIFNRDYKYFTNRRIIKVIRANALLPWFLETFDFQIIYLMRHPIPQSISSINRGHYCAINEYLADDYYKNKYLTEDVIDFVAHISKVGSQLEKYMTEWCLDNLVPIKYLDKNSHKNCLIITYEELVLEPIKMIEMISEKYDLDYSDNLIDQIRKPSKVTDSSTAQTISKIREGDSTYLVEKWKKDIHGLLEKKLMKILSIFEIHIYQLDHFFAEDKYLYFISNTLAQ